MERETRAHFSLQTELFLKHRFTCFFTRSLVFLCLFFVYLLMHVFVHFLLIYLPFSWFINYSYSFICLFLIIYWQLFVHILVYYSLFPFLCTMNYFYYLLRIFCSLFPYYELWIIFKPGYKVTAFAVSCCFRDKAATMNSVASSLHADRHVVIYHHPCCHSYYCNDHNGLILWQRPLYSD